VNREPPGEGKKKNTKTGGPPFFLSFMGGRVKEKDGRGKEEPDQGQQIRSEQKSSPVQLG
jgi:hypothetical protein